MRLELGGSASLTCNVDAKPPVRNVRWTRDGKFIDIKNTLHIPHVTQEAAGRYICQADNGLGILRQREVTLDVQYGPKVSVPSSRDLKEGQNLVVSCNVTANPAPRSIEWFKKGDPNFRQNGDMLRIDRVTAANQGNYICRAVNLLVPTGEESSERSGNATVAVRISHAPGKSYINLSSSVAVLDETFTLSCGADPPGWPSPRYEWRRQDSDTPIVIGTNFTIPRASYSDAGVFSCQPSNEIGKGTKSTIAVKVYQAPSILESLPETAIETVGNTDVSLTCRAQGKPEPSARWVKDGEEIFPTDGLYDVAMQQSAVGSNGVYTVQSKLMFQGGNRINNNQIIAQDRGKYECLFKNDVREVGTSLALQVRHFPMTVHDANKVAFDIGEDAVVVCMMQAFPVPSFQWLRNGNIIHHNHPHYSTNDSTRPDDVYKSELSIHSVSFDDYGEYICKGENTMGEHRTIIKLQPKGPPEPPTDLQVTSASSEALEISWTEGFNGGYEKTSFIVAFESEASSRQEYDCQRNNPCIIRNLDQQTLYNVQVKAHNIKGDSQYSAPIQASTSVEEASIPHPDQVFFEHTNQVLRFRVGSTSLLLVGEVQKIAEGETEWEVVAKDFPLGEQEYEIVSINEKFPEKVQVRLCAAVAEEYKCSDFIEAKKGKILDIA